MYTEIMVILPSFNLLHLLLDKEKGLSGSGEQAGDKEYFATDLLL